MGSKFPLTIFLIVVILSCLALGLWRNPWLINLRPGAMAGPPDDQRLIATFRQHREVFDKLRKLVTEDPRFGSQISASSLKESNLDAANKREAHRLLSEINRGIIVSADYDKSVRFLLTGGGGLSAIGPGWMKGIEFVPGDYRKKGVVLQSLDLAPKLSPGVYLRPIEPGWFLVYQRTD